MEGRKGKDDSAREDEKRDESKGGGEAGDA